MKPERDSHVLCNAKICTKITELLENKLIVFGLTYAVCFDLSHTDDVVRLIRDKKYLIYRE